jgi:hypothetical protein
MEEGALRIETPHQVMDATRLVESVRATKNELAKPHPNPAVLSWLGIGGVPPRDAWTTGEWQTFGISTGLGTIGGLSVALILEATGLKATGMVLGGTAFGGFLGARLIGGGFHFESKIPGGNVGGNLQFGLLPDPVPPREPPTNAATATGEDILRKLLAEIRDLNRHADAHATDQRAKAPGVSAASSAASLLSQFDNVETRRLLQEKAYRADPATLLPLLHLDEASQLLSIPGLLAMPILPKR